MASFLIASAAVSADGSSTNDTFEVITGASAVTVNGLAGDDTVTLSASAVTLGDSTFSLGEGNDTFDINTANSTGFGYVSATIKGGAGEDSLNIGAAAGDVSNVFLAAGEGDDTVSADLIALGATASAVTIMGGESADTIRVASDDDVIGAYIGGGKHADTIVYTGGTLSDSTLIGGFGEDTVSAGMTVDSSLIQLGNGDNSETDSADTFNYSGVIANSTVKGGAGGDTISIQLGDNSTATIIEGNAANDTISISAAADADFESTEFRLGAGDDTFTLSGAVGAAVSADIFGGAGVDNIDVVGSTGIIIEGGAGADDISWSELQQTYRYNFGDSNEGSADQIEAGAADTGDTVVIRIDGSDIAIKTAEASTVSVDSTNYTLTFADGVVYFGDTGINDVTAAVDFLDGALADDQAAVFSFASGEGSVSGATEFYFYAKGTTDETDLVIEMTDIGEVTGGAGYALTEANNFGNTDFTFTV